jgi:endonuclease G
MEYPSVDERLQHAYEVAASTYGDREYVTGIDVGYKHVRKAPTETIAIRFHVVRKIPSPSLDVKEKFPPEIDGVPTDLIEAVYVARAAATPSSGRRKRRDPIQPGISVSHMRVLSGTLGAVVYDKTSGEACILSNWHVLAGSDSAKQGDPIIQPGSTDQGRRPRDTVAQLGRSVLGPDGDAAIGILNKNRRVREDQFGTGVVLREARMPVLGEILQKSGRATGVTSARVDGVGQYTITYSVGRRSVDGFKLVPVAIGNPGNQEISGEGDSGSVWFCPDTNEAVGLLFAGEVSTAPSEEHALACYMPRVLSALNVSLSPARHARALGGDDAHDPE